MASVQNIIDSIKDIPDTYKVLFQITNDDDIISATAKARQIKELYYGHQETAKTDEVAKIKMQKLTEIQQSISDIPEEEIASYNKINSTDSIDIAKAKARAASKAYYNKLIQDAQKGVFDPIMTYCNTKSSTIKNENESASQEPAQQTQNNVSTDMTSGTTTTFNKSQKTTEEIYNDTKKDLYDLLLKAKQEAAADAQQKEENKDYGIATPIVKAEGTIDDIMKKIQDTSDANEDKIAEAAMNATTEKKKTELTILLMADRMAEMATIDVIAKQVSQSHEYLSGLVNKTLLINAYMNKTFGDKSLMKDITETLGKGISQYLDSAEEIGLYNLQQQVDKAEDGIFVKANQQANKVITEAQNVLEKVSKFDLATSLDEELKNCLSIDSLNASLDKTFLGRCLKPGINNLYSSSLATIESQVMNFDFMRDIKKAQDTIIQQEKAIQDAQEFIKTREQMVRTYIDGLKSQAETIIKGYADKVVADIKAAIHIDVGGISI